MSDLYYRIMHSARGDFLTVVTMQDFDEYDYDEKDFMTDEDGDRLKFWDEEEAIQWLHDNVKPELIDPDYCKPAFNRERFLK